MSEKRQPRSRVSGGWAAQKPKPSQKIGDRRFQQPLDGLVQTGIARLTVSSRLQTQFNSPGGVEYKTETVSDEQEKHDTIKRSQVILPPVYGSESKKVQEIKEWGEYVISTQPSGKSTIVFDPHFLSHELCERYFRALHKETDWQEKECTVAGVKYPMPRQISWYAPIDYRFSGATLKGGKKFTETMEEIHRAVEKRTGGRFNAVMLNLYRHGNDSVDWHSDNEIILRVDPTIASVSLGVARVFELRKNPTEGQKAEDAMVYRMNLGDGSLVVMKDHVQDDWMHRIKKDSRIEQCRINLTFRNVFPPNPRDVGRPTGESRTQGRVPDSRPRLSAEQLAKVY